MTDVCKYGYQYQIACNDTVYSLPVLEDYIYYELKALMQQAVAEKEGQEQAVRQARLDLKKCQSRIVLLRQRQTELLQEKRRTFELFSDGALLPDAYKARKEKLRSSSESLQAEIAQWEDREHALSSVSVDPNIITLAQKADSYLSESCLTQEMVTDYVKYIDVYSTDDYRITWRYPEMFGHLQEQLRKKSEKSLKNRQAES